MLVSLILKRKSQESRINLNLILTDQLLIYVLRKLKNYNRKIIDATKDIELEIIGEISNICSCLSPLFIRNSQTKLANIGQYRLHGDLIKFYVLYFLGYIHLFGLDSAVFLI
jgi:hypothetical protein